MPKKLAIFRFDASPEIGAGHAIRSCVIADELAALGWECKIITSQETYDFIPNTTRFERMNPQDYNKQAIRSDLLVVDHYEIDAQWEKNQRPFTKKILVIDDLANRKHDCDILVDQTYERLAEDYKSLVPRACTVLTGCEYALIRREIRMLRPQTLERRRNITQVERILISMGGSTPINLILEAVEHLLEAGFYGHIDLVLGFSSNERKLLEEKLARIPNTWTIHIDPDMFSLLYSADLLLCSAGSTTQEAFCLGIPMIAFKRAENQNNIYNFILQINNMKSPCVTKKYIESISRKNEKFSNVVDGFGVNRVISHLSKGHIDNLTKLRRVKPSDSGKIFSWQTIGKIRSFFNNPHPPTHEEHNAWFNERLHQHHNPYWVITSAGEDCGVLSLTFDTTSEAYRLSWFVIPEFQRKGIGTQALREALRIVHPLKILAHVRTNNVASHKAFQNLGFIKVDEENYISKCNREDNLKC